MQIQVLIVGGAVKGVERVGEGSNTEFNIEMAKPLMFNKDTSRVGEFIMIYKLYLKIKIRRAIVEE